MLHDFEESISTHCIKEKAMTDQGNNSTQAELGKTVSLVEMTGMSEKLLTEA